MNSSNGLLSGRSVKVLQKFEDDYLVEVFRPWNCDEQKLTDTDTVLFRFKTRAALAGRDSSKQEKPRSWEAFFDFESVWQGSTNRLACNNICWLADPLIPVNSCVKQSLLQAIMNVLIVLGGFKTSCTPLQPSWTSACTFRPLQHMLRSENNPPFIETV